MGTAGGVRAWVAGAIALQWHELRQQRWAQRWSTRQLRLGPPASPVPLAARPRAFEGIPPAPTAAPSPAATLAPTTSAIPSRLLFIILIALKVLGSWPCNS
jgi:hypothetical protein